ncbi:hypothetical protein [Cellulophaga baltica]|uniref:Uncharacterized protein n=1 Tax=Cellulophaga baltica TaxID=76594 RepID=A0A1G7JN24_9FLAO|nr:hypothetical protein [Cellulophaga baltica]SDF26255.1 hypothetical protein SAMN04487992_1108 [Cellulophaga baltica]
MKKFENFKIEKTEMICGGEHWDTGCRDNKRTDIYDDVAHTIVYFEL